MSDVLVKPAFQSAIADSGSPTQLGPNAWNAARLFSGGTEGDLCVRAAAASTGAAWSASLTNLTVTGTFAVGVVNVGTPAISFSAAMRILGAGANVMDLQSTTLTANIYMSPTGADRWIFGAGQILPNDFGLSNNTRGTVPLVISGGASGGQTLLSSAAGVQLQFSGRTSSFSALKSSGTTLAVRLADDSTDASLSALHHLASGYYEGTEMAAPGGGAANTGRLYFDDNGSGKTRLMVVFNTGVAIQLAIQV